MAADFTLIRAGVPVQDDCKILTRLKAFVVSQGVCATLEHTFRDRKGNPLDLSDWLAAAESQSLSASTSSSTSAPAGTLQLRVKEWVGCSTSTTKNPVWTVYGEAVDPTTGLVRAELSADMVERAAIYELNWGVLNETGVPVAIDRGIMSVEKSLFPADVLLAYKDQGPPTLQEIRMRMMDSSKNENTLLDDVEFDDEQIMLALATPIREWNESPPNLKRAYTTRDFPFRGAWISGALAQLHLMAAHHYRRNTMRTAAGGTSDKDKEKEYKAEGNQLWAEYVAWMRNKKVEMNMMLFAGQSISQYSTRGGW